MAGQSITFDFLTRGADATASGFRKVGDNTVLAAKGAKVLSDAIESLGKKEGRTADESVLLAKALRQTGDAEDRVAARAVLADAAIRKLDDAMKDAAKKPLVPEVISAKALAKLTEIKVRAEELKRDFPEFTARIDTTAAKLKLAALAAEAKATDDAINRGFGGGGGGGILSRLFSGGGGPAAGGGLPGGPALALGAPAAALAAALTPGIVGLGIGGAVGGAAIGGGLFGAAEGKKVLDADLSTIKTLTIKLKTAIGQQKTEISAALKDAEKQYAKDAAFFAPFTAFQSSLQDLAKTLLAPLRTVMGPLAAMFTQFGKGLAALAPQFTALFKASLPFIQQFLDLMLQAGKVLLPAFTAAMQTMVKSGALQSMTDGLVIIVKGLAGFITALGPGMAASATIFKGIAVIIAAVLRGLGLAFSYMANTFLDNMHSIRETVHNIAGWFDTARHEVAHIWAVLMSDIATLFDVAKNKIGIIWDQIELTFLHGVQYILNIMGKLPGPLGAPFRAAKISIGNSMAAIQADVRARTAQIQADFDRLHGKTVQIHMNGQGLYTISGSVIAASQGKGGSGNAAGGLAAGGFISGGTPGRDSVFAALMPGEVVVPTRMVKAGAVDHLRGQLPGFASGGQVSGPLTAPFVSGMYSSFQNQMTSSMVGAMRTSLKTAEAAAKAAAAAAAASGFGVAGPGGGAPAANAALARRMMPSWGSGAEWNAWNYLEMREAGWNQFARNPSSGAYGIPQALPPGKMGAAANPPQSNPAAQISWMIGYIRSRYGDPIGAANHERAFNWYGKGGLVPGYASGGTVAQQGQTFLNAWRSRRGGPYALAVGPRTLNQQIPAMAAALSRARTLAGAGGLSKGQHKFWAGTAAGESRLLATLRKELSTEQAWRYQLGLGELALDKEIKAAGNLPGLAGPVRGWKAQLAAHKYTIGQISGMIGLTAAQAAAAAKAKPPGPPASPVPVTHTYGGDVADTIGTVLAAALGPFTGAARGGMVFDSGGTLRPGFNPVWNGTGRPEQLVPARGGGTVRLEVSSGGSSEFDQFMTGWLRKHVKVKGGGSVQHAFGSR